MNNLSLVNRELIFCNLFILSEIRGLRSTFNFGGNVIVGGNIGDRTVLNIGDGGTVNNGMPPCPHCQSHVPPCPHCPIPCPTCPLPCDKCNDCNRCPDCHRCKTTCTTCTGCTTCGTILYGR